MKVLIACERSSMMEVPVLEPLNHYVKSYGHHLPENDNRAYLRSKTFINIAWAMAQQWGKLPI